MVGAEGVGKWTGRSSGKAPNIDSGKRIRAKELHVGQLITARITGADGYDLIAEAATRKGKSLAVIG